MRRWCAQLWTGRLTDACFTLGGVLYAGAAATRSGGGRPPGPRRGAGGGIA